MQGGGGHFGSMYSNPLTDYILITVCTYSELKILIFFLANRQLEYRTVIWIFIELFCVGASLVSLCQNIYVILLSMYPFQSCDD